MRQRASRYSLINTVPESPNRLILRLFCRCLALNRGIRIELCGAVRHHVDIHMRVFFFWVLSLAFISSLYGDDYDDLRLGWKNTIVGMGYDMEDSDVVLRLNSIASLANAYWASMDKSPERTYLWSDAASTSKSTQITTNYSRLRAMALAYATPGCSLAGDAALLTDVIGGLEWMKANRYNPTKSIYDNWWDFEIGSPLQLTDIAVLLYDQLTPTQLTNYMDAVEKFTPSATTAAAGGTSGTFTGANRMWKIRVVAVRGAVVKSSAKLTAARDAFSNLFAYVTSGDGFYADGSYIQHSYHPYTAGYGASLLSNMMPVMAWLSGSTWAVTDPAQSHLYQWVYDSFEPIIYRGAAWDLVRGREAGRANTSPQPTGHSIMDSILQMSQFAPPADAARLKSMVKEWALSDTVRDFISPRPLPTLPLAKALMADAAIPRRGELIGHYTFAEMDRVVHLGAGYGMGLTLCSSRIANFESINGENLRGWFTGDGMTVLYNADLNAFADAYWATIDPYRLPGVTADVTHNKLPSVAHSIGPRAQGESTRSPHNWVGGATLGNFGAAGMQFKGVGVTLTGKKSWFMFDDEVVCLGAGITSTDNRPIETTVENRKLTSAGSNAFTVNGTAKSAALGWSETMNDVSWAHLAGNVGDSDIGYFFPQAATVTALREARTGAWSDIDSDGSTAGITRNYLRMSFEHGSSPTNASYEYVLLPGRSAAHVRHYAEQPQTVVIANSPEVQAVSETTLGITAANFWTDSTQTAGILTANKKACVLVRNDGTFLDVSISDPTQSNTGVITLQIDTDGGSLVSADAGVTVTQTSPIIALTVNVSGAQGRTFKARFYLGTPEVMKVTAEADAYVYDAAVSVDTNYGTASTLVLKKSGVGYNRETFFRFNVPNYNGVLVGATLQLSPLSASTPGIHGVALVADNSWSETGITWNNKPAVSGPVLSTWTPEVGTRVDASVSSVVTGPGQVSFKAYATTQTADGYVTYASRENSSSSSRPELALLIGHTPPEINITSPKDGAYISRGDDLILTVDAQATDGAVTLVSFYDGETLIGTDSAPPYSLTHSFAGGAHHLTAVATDANGLSKTSLDHWIDVAFPPEAGTTTVTTPKDTAIEVDLRSLVSDVETPVSQLLFEVGPATHGNVALLADGHTASFTPTLGYQGVANFDYAVTDATPDERTLLNYDFQNSDISDASTAGREGGLNLQGNGEASYTADVPTVLSLQHSQSLILTENGTAGAARVERSLATEEVDFKNGDWTVSGWFKRGQPNNMDVIVQMGDSGGYGSNALTLAFYGGGSTLELRNYAGSVQDVGISKSNVSIGAWHHVAIVRSGSVLSWYLDGSLVGSDADFSFGFDNSKPLKFGGPGSVSVLDRWLNGALADLAVFSAALMPVEITKLNSAPAAYLGGLSRTNSVGIQVLSAFEAWSLLHFGSFSNAGMFADAADKDHDGTANLLEYALAMDPNVSDQPFCHHLKSGTNIEFIYTRNKAATDVNYSVEWSDDLTPESWTTNGVSVPSLVPGSDDGLTQQLKVIVPTDGTVTQRFIRLRVELF